MARLYHSVTLSLQKYLQLTFLTAFKIVLISTKGLIVTCIKSNDSSVSPENLRNFWTGVEYEKEMARIYWCKSFDRYYLGRATFQVPVRS
jgi:hypothetical protein